MNTHDRTEIFQIRDISVVYAMAQARPPKEVNLACAALRSRCVDLKRQWWAT